MPFAIAWPGHIRPGTTDEQSVITAVDMLPTLSKMSGVSLPTGYHSDGVDRSSVFFGKPSERGKDIFWEYGRNDVAFKYPQGRDKSPNLAVRSGDWKLLMNNNGKNVQLFNIATDKNEATDVAAANSQVVDGLKVKLMAWWKEMPRLR